MDDINNPNDDDEEAEGDINDLNLENKNEDNFEKQSNGYKEVTQNLFENKERKKNKKRVKNPDNSLHDIYKEEDKNDIDDVEEKIREKKRKYILSII